jgi:hypothetical protein
VPGALVGLAEKQSIMGTGITTCAFGPPEGQSRFSSFSKHNRTDRFEADLRAFRKSLTIPHTIVNLPFIGFLKEAWRAGLEAILRTCARTWQTLGRIWGQEHIRTDFLPSIEIIEIHSKNGTKFFMIFSFFWLLERARERKNLAHFHIC